MKTLKKMIALWAAILAALLVWAVLQPRLLPGWRGVSEALPVFVILLALATALYCVGCGVLWAYREGMNRAR